MRIRSEYKLRSIAGETIIVKQGTNEVDLTKVISLNSSASIIYQELADKDFSKEDIIEIILDKYDTDRETAEKGAQAWIDSMKECNLIEE